VYRQLIDEKNKTLDLWVRRKRGNRKLECSGCGRKFTGFYDSNERQVRDLPWSEFRTTVHIEVYRVKCPICGLKVEKVPLLPSKAPFSKRFEDAVGQACENASARRVAQQFGLPESTVRAIDLRYLERWEAARRKPALRQMGVDEIFLGKQQKFITVVCNLETGEPLWFGRERKKETLDEFFRTQLSSGQRQRIQAACVDMWEPFRLSIEEYAPRCKIVYDKFHIMQHANTAIDEVRRAEFFRKGGEKRELVKGKRWLLLTRWVNLSSDKKQELSELLAINRKLFKAYLLKESLDRLWTYAYEGAMLRYLQSWIDQLRWQRLPSFQKLAQMLLDHLDGILNYCKTKVPLGVVEAVNGNIKCLVRRGRGYKNLRYLLLKAQRMTATKVEFMAFKKAA
jgi:transposase